MTTPPAAFQTTSNKTDPVTLIAPGTVITVAGNGPAVETDEYAALRLALNVSAASGTTPSLTVNVQTSADAGVLDAWRTVASFAAQTAVTANPDRGDFGPIDKYVRAQWAGPTGTTPSFTVGLVGDAA